LDDAVLTRGAIDLVVAHGTATRQNDVVEGRALREVFGDDGAFPALAAVKSMMGHAMGASGAIGAAAAVFALGQSAIPPTINLETLDPLCAVSGFSPVAAPRALRHAMVNAFAFGGHNAVLVLSRA
jgi:3-oxoacyl-[acyl-carrier-protein] synthase II